MLNVEDLTKLTTEVWAGLEDFTRRSGEEKISVVSLQEFQQLAESAPLDRQQKLLIVNQAEKLLRHFYAHAPYKDLHAALDALQLLYEKLAREDVSEQTFHNMMSYSFLKLDDAHTVYGRPFPFRNSFAFLPFQLKQFDSGSGCPRYVVSKIVPGFQHDLFRVGAEILEWSDVTTSELIPMQTAVSRSARMELGTNPAASAAYGLRRMHLRLLTSKIAPIQSHVKIVYTAPGDPTQRNIQIPWGVVMGASPAVIFENRVLSCSELAASEGSASMHLYKRPGAEEETQKEFPIQNPVPESSLGEIFEIQHSAAPRRPRLPDPAHLTLQSPAGETKKFGYIRIRNFDLMHKGPLGREDLIAAEFQRLLELQMEHAPDGLILDLRGNPGGNVRAAESLLQMLTPKEIVPAKFHWIRNETIRKSLLTLDEANQKLLRGALEEQEQGLFDFLLQQFEAWLDDLKTWDDDEAAEDPKKLSSGKHWSSAPAVNSIGQIYQGPVVLLVDGFTYSAADIFTGGFQDHAIGPVLGLDDSTGGGGGMVKQHKDLLPLAPILDLGLQPLPEGVTMSVAILRSARVDGSPIEGIGVQTDTKLHRRREDILNGNPFLFAEACRILSELPAYCLKMTGDLRFSAEGLELPLQCRGFDQLEVLVDQQRIEAAVLANGILRIPVQDFGHAKMLFLRGLDEQGNLVVCTRKWLTIPGLDSHSLDSHSLDSHSLDSQSPSEQSILAQTFEALTAKPDTEEARLVSAP